MNLQAAKWYRIGADAGDRDAQMNYAIMLSQGAAGVSKDPHMAGFYMLKAARAGNGQAMLNVAGAFDEANNGAIILPKDPIQGKLWMYQAAQTGHPLAVQCVSTWPAELTEQISELRDDGRQHAHKYLDDKFGD